MTGLVALLSLALALTQAAGTSTAIGVSALQGRMIEIDSLYEARDTVGLAAALSRWNGADTPRIRFYRGISAGWRGSSRDAVTFLRPVVDSGAAMLDTSERRQALLVLGESYSRTGRYQEMNALYDRELQLMQRANDEANARANALADSIRNAPIISALTSPEQSTPPPAEKIPSQVGLIALLFALFLIPKVLQRIRIPGAITALVMGAGATALGWFEHDLTLSLLSTLGIVSLFLFAGLEIEGRELRSNLKPLLLHAAIWAGLAIATGIIAAIALDVPPRAAALISLALVTPSTGFILSTLKSFGLNAAEQKSVRTYAIGSELIALAALFFVLQSTSAQHLLLAIVAMAGIVVVIPIAFRGFATLVAPYAPRSEFAFLLMVAVACAYATRLLGVYYLVGAFLVGVAAQRFRGSHPAMSSEKMIDALEAFGSVFIPFYFFHAGTEIHSEHLGTGAILMGLLLVAVVVPVRVGLIGLHRRLALGERFADSRKVASAMVPTLVFTLVIDGILIERFGLSPQLAGALVLYTVVNTTLPAFVLRAQPADFEDVEALPVDSTLAEG
ncbi:MAG TPA: cation:proton antiporter [Gemmatimonadaceae bacterium]